MDTFGFSGTYTLEQAQTHDEKRNLVVGMLQTKMDLLGHLKYEVQGILESSKGEIILASIEELESAALKGQERLQTVVDEFIRFHWKFEEVIDHGKTQPFMITYLEVPKN
ncbi:hypothetical protein JOC54_000012 [Alkalihalobacillus xiaoxiensis]|uniref:Uncharacterized protein n=1 Tax=Shouchella xiaoxiensis TaxID=766895 RepID=A0ABS2SMN8_9BACI|nr:hypothetical protein [Shouchella xiaoxiensis]MBM7836781.1 hypothetical protein [Shouchella xiaoxiensis]